jgi:2-iminobutanoate/2-iminopropanoate deaminase
LLSQAIDTGSLVFVAGQINNTATGDIVGDNVETKLAQIMQNISVILAAAELTLDDIVKVTIYVTDMAQMPEINRYYPAYFSAPLPAREAICVKELPLGATIEVSVIAAR